MSADRSNRTSESQKNEVNKKKDVRNDSCSWREVMERRNIKIKEDLYFLHAIRKIVYYGKL